jgi:hypothetical protein
MTMSPEQIAETANFYGIDLEEAERRYRVLSEHRDDPEDPICVGCARRPAELPEYDYLIEEFEGEHFDQDGNFRELTLAEKRREACLAEEGTLNRENGHFLCNEDYIRNGSPSSPRGWVCP